ncbi:MAG: hypothetical protein CVV02_13960 [Firmicutes bacterium HGW-Firmicutes-7]|nr:MAG: hypothetical protein CVV02_13960 [Firmicutes bacterium HGW-Firmicutes-7]
MNAVAVSRVATNMSKNFDTKGKTTSNAFDSILGSSMKTRSIENSTKVGHQASKIQKSEYKETKKTEQVDQSKPPTSKKIDVEKVEQKVLEKVAKKLGISEEELNEIMATLNLNFMDLFSNKGIQALVNEVFGTKNEVELLTNEEAFSAFKDIKQELNQILNEEEIDFKDLHKAVTDYLKDTSDKASNETIKVPSKENIEETKPQQVINGVKVEVEDSRVKTDQSRNTNEAKPLEVQVEDNNTDHKNQGNRNNGFENQFNNALSQTVVQKFEVVSPNGIDEIVFQETTVKDIFTQITTQVKLSITNDSKTMLLQLQPENLGKIAFSVRSENGMMTGQIVAENNSVKEAIEMNLASLKTNLEQQGIKLDEIKVVTGNTNQFFSKSDQQKDSNQFSKGKRRRNLEAVSQMDDIKMQDMKETLRSTGLEEEENSVDYSA